MNYHYHNSIKIENISGITDHYSTNEFFSPYRSTIYLLSFVQSQLFTFFLEQNEINIGKANLFFEYPVSQKLGKGKASCTDLIVIDDKKCVAIEAKSTETKYQTVSKWLGNSDNRMKVLDGWLQIINSRLALNIAGAEIKDITYQMIHRLASACSEKEKTPEMIYLYFGNKSGMVDYYRNELNFLKTTTKSKIKISLYQIEIQKTAKMKQLENEWGKRNRDLSDGVKKGIVANNLLEFSKEGIKILID
jgi:hypothetical protein